MDSLGKILVEDKYAMIGSCNINNSKTFVASMDGKWGIVSIDGKQISPFNYDAIVGIENSSNYLAVKNNTVFLLTSTGKTKRQFYNISLEVNSSIKSSI